MITTILILLPLILTDVLTEDLTDKEEKCSVLQFQLTSGSRLETRPDFSRATKSLSYCLWYKKEQTGSQRVLLNYRPTSGGIEILITDDASTRLYFMGYGTTDNKPTVPLNKWMHYCTTWSRASLVTTFYLNGQVIATGSSPDRDFDTTATLYIGSYNSGDYLLGGEMTGLEFYSSRLTPEQVWRAYKEGPCSPRYFSSSLLTNLILGWSDITKLTRPAGVTEIFIESDNSNLLDLLNLTPNMTSQLIQELKEEIITDIITDDGLMKELKENVTEEIKPDQKLEVRQEASFWDVLYTSPLYNNVITNDTIEKLVAKVETLSHFVSYNLTEILITHLKRDDEGDNRGSWSILADFVGEEITNGLLDHLSLDHEDD